MKRIFGLLCACLAGLALCAAVVTDVAERAPGPRHISEPLGGKVWHWFGGVIDHMRDRLAALPSEAGKAHRAPIVPTDRALLLGRDITGLREAIAFYKTGDLVHGDAAAKTARDALVATTLEWVALRGAPREAGFDRLAAFRNAHPDWPGNVWLFHRMEAALYFGHATPARVAAFFASSAPSTVPGKLALARTLESDGKKTEAAALARAVWRDADLNGALENKVKSDFGSYFEKSDHRSRADRLLSRGDNGAALRAATLAGTDVVTLVKLRIAALNETVTDKMFAAVPAPLQSDPDFILAKVQKLRHAEKYKEAAALVPASARGSALFTSDDWSAERRLLARKVLDTGDAKLAYKIVADNVATSNEARIDAEFLAGWIALRFLNDPARASGHFAAAAELAETPVSVARAAYWQGRAADISADADAYSRAKAFYQTAAAETSTYYGQLARTKLGLEPIVNLRNLSHPASGRARSDAVNIVELLFAIGESELARTLACEIAQYVSDESQLAALSTVITIEQDAHAALAVGKILGQRHIADDSLAFPTYGIPRFDPLENSAPPAVVYAVARQESAFDTRANSSAGAKGLMQMITETAKHTAEHAGLDFSADKLAADAAFNAKLGAAHLGQLLRAEGGSYILTFAAYNAGGGRVKQWMEAYGDPRSAGVDPIDWVERIPFTETRNYVERVLENLAIYRVRLGDPQPAQDIGQANVQVHTAAK